MMDERDGLFNMAENARVLSKSEILNGLFARTNSYRLSFLTICCGEDVAIRWGGTGECFPLLHLARVQASLTRPRPRAKHTNGHPNQVIEHLHKFKTSLSSRVQLPSRLYHSLSHTQFDLAG